MLLIECVDFRFGFGAELFDPGLVVHVCPGDLWKHEGLDFGRDARALNFEFFEGGLPEVRFDLVGIVPLFCHRVQEVFMRFVNARGFTVAFGFHTGVGEALQADGVDQRFGQQGGGGLRLNATGLMNDQQDGHKRNCGHDTGVERPGHGGDGKADAESNRDGNHQWQDAEQPDNRGFLHHGQLLLCGGQMLAHLRLPLLLLGCGSWHRGRGFGLAPQQAEEAGVASHGLAGMPLGQKDFITRFAEAQERDGGLGFDGFDLDGDVPLGLEALHLQLAQPALAGFLRPLGQVAAAVFQSILHMLATVVVAGAQEGFLTSEVFVCLRDLFVKTVLQDFDGGIVLLAQGVAAAAEVAHQEIFFACAFANGTVQPAQQFDAVAGFQLNVVTHNRF